jgi:hypothetical protein
MSRIVLACIVALLVGCGSEADRGEEAARVRRITRNCSDRLISAGRDWYDGLQLGMSEERFAAEVQVLLDAAGWVRTYKIVLDDQGIPTDVTWNQEFWDAASLVMDLDELRVWKVWSVEILNEVRTATGIAAPPSWRGDAAKPTTHAIADESGVPLETAFASLEQFIPTSSQGVVTQRLRSLMSTFPAHELFQQPPSAD